MDSCRTFFLISTLVAAGTPVHGAQPPDVVQSDTSDNTAMGLDALLSVTTGAANTASGVYALRLNTSGYQNTALAAGRGPIRAAGVATLTALLQRGVQ